ncbi:MAG TPA: spore coat U domain-containing protein, partial [Methylibium sp.]
TFHAYTDPARTAGWGNTTVSSINAQFSTSTKGQWTLNPAVIYGRVDAGQTSAVPGSYSYASNAITMAVNFVKSTAGSPSDCQGLALNPTTQTLTATASVVQTCTVSTTTLNFGTPGLLNANVDGTSTITTQCASGTAYQIGLDNGLHASGTTRQMAGGSSELIAYELYRDSSRTQRWGNTLNSDTVSISGTANTGAALTTTVYGRVAAQSTPSPSSYSDTITVTVTY